MRLNGGDLRKLLADRCLDGRRDVVRLVEGERPGELEVKRYLDAVAHLEHGDVVDLAHARRAQRGRERPLPQRRLVDARLDVNDHVGPWQRVLDGVLDRIGDRVPLADGGGRGDTDDHVREVATGSVAHSNATELDTGAELLDRVAHRVFGPGRSTIHQHVHVAPHEPGRGDEDDRRDEERRGGVGLGVARPRGEQSEENGDRAGQIRAEMERPCREGGAQIAAGGPYRDDAATGIDDDHDHDRREREPGDVDVGRRPAREPRNRKSADRDAHGREDRRLGKCGEVLGLAVAVLVTGIGGPDRDADGEERQERRDEVDARMGGLGEQAEAARGKSGRELDRDQDRRRNDRHERGAALGAHETQARPSLHR